jgi:ribose transport system substrate-binding protein
VIVALYAVGCGESEEAEGGGGGSESAASTDLGGKTIGVLSLCEACEGVHRMTEGMQESAEAVGWEIRLVDGQGAPDKLLAGLNALVQEKVDAIVLEAVEPAMVKGALDAAIEAKIPVITQDVGHTTPGVLTDISPDEAANTALLDEEMVKLLGNEPAKIAAIRYMSLKTTSDRFKQLEKDAEANDLTIVQAHDSVAPNFADDAAKFTTEILTANPDIGAIWSASTGDPAAIGAARAVSRMKSDAIVVGYNGDMDALAALREGGPFKATIAFPVEKGSWTTVDVLLQHFSGKDVPNEQIFLPGAVVTADNVPADGEGYYNEWGDDAETFTAKWRDEYGIGE